MLRGREIAELLGWMEASPAFAKIAQRNRMIEPPYLAEMDADGGGRVEEVVLVRLLGDGGSEMDLPPKLRWFGRLDSSHDCRRDDFALWHRRIDHHRRSDLGAGTPLSQLDRLAAFQDRLDVFGMDGEKKHRRYSDLVSSSYS